MALSIEERAEIISANGFTCLGVANFGALGEEMGRSVHAEIQHMRCGATRVICPMLKNDDCYQALDIHRTGCPYKYCPKA